MLAKGECGQWPTLSGRSSERVARHPSQRGLVTLSQGVFRIIHNRGGGSPTPPPFQTLVTIVGKNEINRWENLVGPFLVHTLLGPSPPPPVHPPPPKKKTPCL